MKNKDEYTHIIPELKKYLSDDPIWEIHSHDLDLKANHIYLMGIPEYMSGTGTEDLTETGVEYIMANRFIKNLNIMMRKSEDPILIHMKTCGGFWEEGMAIYDVIKACPNEICILNYTHARSMSSIIFQAADKRVMMPNSSFMFHHGSMGYEGTTTQFLTEAKQLEKTKKTMIDLYVDKLKEKGSMKKWSRKRIEEYLEIEMQKKEEVYLDASETVKMGFADEVFGANGQYDWSGLLDFDKE